MEVDDGELAIQVQNLSYSFSTSDGRKTPVLFDINLNVKHGSRLLIMFVFMKSCINWQSKETNVVEKWTERSRKGKHLTDDRDSVKVLGKPAFFQTLGVSGISFLGNSMWTRPVAFVGNAVAYEADIAAGDMLADLQKEHRERRDQLVELLDIDLNWRLNQVSDGQRRRIQIMLGLLQPFTVLLIDEFTVDLDVLARRNLLDYLKRETEQRNCTILYCTHIFDGMDEWPTESLFMAEGRIDKIVRNPLPVPLYQLCLDFMIESRKKAKAKNIEPTKPLTEEFGAQGYSAGRIVPSTDFFAKNRMNDYRF